MDPKRWWVRRDQKTLGPCTLAELQALPGISGTAWVCPEGSTEKSAWRRAQDVPDVAKVLGLPGPIPSAVSVPAAPPPPPPIETEGVSKEELQRKIDRLRSLRLGTPWHLFRFIFKSKRTGTTSSVEKRAGPRSVLIVVGQLLKKDPDLELADIQDLGVCDRFDDLQRTGSLAANRADDLFGSPGPSEVSVSGTRTMRCRACGKETVPVASTEPYKYTAWVPRRQRDLVSGHDWVVEQEEDRVGSRRVLLCRNCGNVLYREPVGAGCLTVLVFLAGVALLVGWLIAM